MEEVVSLESAHAEITAWLDRKRVMNGQRKDFEAQINTLVEAVQYGILIVNDDGTLTHKLIFPLESTTELTYKARITSVMLDGYLKGVKAADADARVWAYVACLTSKTTGLLKHMDSQDTRIAQAIVVFFL